MSSSHYLNMSCDQSCPIFVWRGGDSYVFVIEGMSRLFVMCKSNIWYVFVVDVFLVYHSIEQSLTLKMYDISYRHWCTEK